MPKPHRIIPPLKSQDILRFWSHVRIGKPDECWEWQTGRAPYGYGRFALSSCSGDFWKMFQAHRVAWTISRGPIPLGMCVLHHCDNPPCVNPAHLFLGSRADNTHDMMHKGRGRNPPHPFGAQHWSHRHPERVARGKRNGAYTHPERVPRGERNGLAKLTEQEVRHIRQRHAAGGITLAALGRERGVTTEAIWCIVHRKTWAHI